MLDLAIGAEERLSSAQITCYNFLRLEVQQLRND
jgi:hypothetical protein